MEHLHAEQSPASIHAGNSLSLANVLSEQSTKAHTHTANACNGQVKQDRLLGSLS